jgi:hypothetical protein
MVENILFLTAATAFMGYTGPTTVKRTIKLPLN